MLWHQALACSGERIAKLFNSFRIFVSLGVLLANKSEAAEIFPVEIGGNGHFCLVVRF